MPVFNHFDAFFEEHIKPRSDLQLKVGPAKADPPFPVDNCLAVLRATAVLLEHCSNKQLYNSYEVSACSLQQFAVERRCRRLCLLHASNQSASSPPVALSHFADCSSPRSPAPQHLASLLAAPQPAVVLATLQVLTAFLKKTHHVTIRWHGYPALNARLLRMCKGWGSRDDGLDMVTAASDAATPSVEVRPSSQQRSESFCSRHYSPRACYAISRDITRFCMCR